MRLRTLHSMIVPAAALAVLLAGGTSAQAQDHERGGRQARDRGRQSEGRAVPRSDSRGTRSSSAPVTARRNDDRGRPGPSGPAPGAAYNRGYVDGYRNAPRVIAPSRPVVVVPPRPVVVAPRPVVVAPRPYAYAPGYVYGPRTGVSVYFNWGSGYLYGAPYRGRVYGYSAPVVAYGEPRYYGDVRLQLRPRGAAVYVDGYYAGVVDDFDGMFQRLTLDAGPHEIAISAPGYETQVYNVYADPSRTVDVRGDLLPIRP